MSDPWTLYWRSNNRQSCMPTSDDASVPALDKLWASFATSLPVACSVLDLATGNGIVPSQLLGVREDLQITAADRAAINPLHNLHDPDALCLVQFRPGIDLADPAMHLGTFAAVTSQFGIEYLPAHARASAVERHLAPGGRFCLVVHHSASAIVMPRAADLQELDTLLDENGPAQAAQGFAQQQLDAVSLERLTHAFMQRKLRRTQRLSGRVVQGVDRLLTVLETGDASGARLLAGDLALRVMAERERLAQLLSAALDASAAAAFTAALRAAGLECDEPSVITDTVSARDTERQTQEVVLAWRLTGHRPPPAADSSV
jgi:hypothetical protein